MKKTIQTCTLTALLLFFASLTRTQAQTATSQQGFNDVVKPNPIADKDIQFVSDYLNALVAGDFDKVRSSLTPNYKGRGPGILDSFTVKEVIKSWQWNDSAQTNRKIEFTPATYTVLTGEYKGTWVDMWGSYSFTLDGKNVTLLFQYTAHLTNGKIDFDIAYYDRLYMFQALGYTLTPPNGN